MLMCKGKGCRYRGTCSRYVLGRAMKAHAGITDTWIDHCVSAKRYDKYMPLNGADGGPGKERQ